MTRSRVQVGAERKKKTDPWVPLACVSEGEKRGERAGGGARGRGPSAGEWAGERGRERERKRAGGLGWNRKEAGLSGLKRVFLLLF
jgi:hypothetical protein